MEPLTYILWKWRDQSYDVTYTADHVNTMVSMLTRHTHAPHRIVCITDDPEGIACETFPLWSDYADLKNESWRTLVNNSDLTFPSCYRRLKLFSTKTTEALGIQKGERVVSIDLDVVITDTLDPLFERRENFIGWHSSGGAKLNGFNGSVWMYRAESCDFLWDTFNPVESLQKALEKCFYGSDQGWISYCMYDTSPQWNSQDGVRRFTPELSKHGPNLVPGTRIAIFCGRWKPWHKEAVENSPWIKEHYK